MPAVLLLFVCALALTAADPKILAPEIIQSRFGRIHSANDERAAEIRRLFTDAGCGSSDYSEETIQSSKLPNLVCMIPGTSKETLVVSAHFDNRGPGEGAIDNWSGSSLLPSLYESLRGSPHRLTIEFIAFTDEEKGLIGSRDHVNHLSKADLDRTLLDVNIDSIGLAGPIRIWSGRTDVFLMNAAAIVADRAKIPISAAALDRRYDSDAAAFMAWNIPVIDLHSLTPDTIHMLHSKRDVRAAIDAKSYYDDYRFLAAFLAYLDEVLDVPKSR
jgi:Iap family predicted aminopeptidase